MTHQAIRCIWCAYVDCRCPDVIKAEDTSDEAFIETFRRAMDENPGVPPVRHSAELKAAVAAELPAQQPQDMRPLLDDILDATQKHLAAFVPVLNPAKIETQKYLPVMDDTQARAREQLAGLETDGHVRPAIVVRNHSRGPVVARIPIQEPKAAPAPTVRPGKRSLRDLAALL